MWGLSSQTSFLQRIHQSPIFRDQFRISVCFVTLEFKEPLHQQGEVSHDFLRGWLPITIRDGTNGRVVISDQVGAFSKANSRNGLLQNAKTWGAAVLSVPSSM
jgi:hypothetical protein